MVNSTGFFLRDNDKKVKLLLNGTPVSNSSLQSVYARYLNLLGNFSASVNNNLDSYDITNSDDGKVVVKSNGSNVGTGVALYPNFSTDFNVAANSPNYDISLKYPSQILTKLNNTQIGTQPRYLNFSTDFNDSENSGNNTYDISLKYTGLSLFQNNGVAVNTVPRKINILNPATMVENVSNNSVDITTASPQGNYDPTTGKKYGSLIGGGGWTNTSAPGVALGDGFMTGWRAVGRFDSNYTNSNVNDANGSPYVITTGSTAGNNAYYTSSETFSGSGTTAPFNLNANPTISARIALPSVTSIRVFWGFYDTVPLPTNVDLLTGIHGFGIRFDPSVDTFFTMLNNNGLTNSTVTPSTITPVARTVYTIKIWGDKTNNKFGYSINGGTPVYATTNIPNTNSGNYGLGYICFIQGTSKLMYVYLINGSIDK